MLIDENAGHRGVFVDYFGRPASTSRLPAQLSLMTGAPVVLGAAVRQEGRARFLPSRDVRAAGSVGRAGWGAGPDRANRPAVGGMGAPDPITMALGPLALEDPAGR